MGQVEQRQVYGKFYSCELISRLENEEAALLMSANGMATTRFFPRGPVTRQIERGAVQSVPDLSVFVAWPPPGYFPSPLVPFVQPMVILLRMRTSALPR